MVEVPTTCGLISLYVIIFIISYMARYRNLLAVAIDWLKTAHSTAKVALEVEIAADRAFDAAHRRFEAIRTRMLIDSARRGMRELFRKTQHALEARGMQDTVCYITSEVHPMAAKNLAR